MVVESSSPSSSETLLSLKGIHKSFGPVKALDDVNLEVRRGEVHALIGENGAGKSTLMKILSGAHLPDKGSMTLRGEPYSITNPAQGRSSGVAMIYQELNLALHLSVAENITLGVEESKLGFVRQKRDKVLQVLEWMGHGDLDVDRAVGSLSISLKQIVEIARALFADAGLIVMDEPTSSLSAADTQTLFRVIRRLRDKGISIIYITHFLEEVLDVGDRYTVLRDGKTVAMGHIKDATVKMLIEKMIGRSMSDLYPERTCQPGEQILAVNGLRGIPTPDGVSLKLHRGEILGIGGLVGSGRSETVRCLFGINKASDGAVSLKGHPEIKAVWLSPPRALTLGMGLLSENRKEEGLAQTLSLSANITLSALRRYSTLGVLSLGGERRAARKWCEDLSIKCRDVSDPAASLSGGNQQKVALARLLHHDSDILFLDEPTKGIDVGSKAEIYALLHKLAAQGKAIIVISSYLPELMGICDTIAVMHRGTMSHARPAKDWSEHEIMVYATTGSVG
jgi:ribose transport system ATP-binding protein